MLVTDVDDDDFVDDRIVKLTNMMKNRPYNTPVINIIKLLPS